MTDTPSIPPTPLRGLDFEPGACPHCGATGHLERHVVLRWVCAVCGGPRLPGVPSPPAREASALRRSFAEWRGKQTRGVAAAGLTGLGVVLAGGAVAGLLAGALAAPAVLGAAAVVAAVGGAGSRAKARARAKAARGAVDEAWDGAVARALDTAGRHLTAAELATALRLEEPEAEELLGRLAAGDRVRVHLGDDAELRYGEGDETGEAQGRRRAP